MPTGPFRRFFTSPAHADPEWPPPARLLHNVVGAAMVVVTAVMVLGLLVRPDLSPRLLVVILGADTVGVIALALNRGRRTRAAAWTFVAGFTILVGALAPTAGGIHSLAIAADVLVVLLASLLLGPPGGVLTGAVLIVWGLALALAEQLGMLPPSRVAVTPTIAWLINAMVITIAIVIQRLATAAVRSAMERFEGEAEVRRRAEQAAEQSEQKFSRVFQHAPVGMSVTELTHGRLIDMNDEFLRLLGYSREEVIGRTTTELGIWPDPDARAALVARVKNSGLSLDDEQPLRTKTGDIVVVRASAHRVDVEGETVMVSAAVDVTARKRAEDQLRHSEQQYRELVDGVRDVIVAMTPDGVLTALNAAFEPITGLRRQDWLGKPFVALLHPDDVPLAIANFQAVLSDVYMPVTPYRIMTAHGTDVIAEIYLSPRRVGGQVVGVLGIARDVTDRVKLEHRFREAQKMEAIGLLAGGIAHDFNNMLGVILGHAELAMRQLDPAQRVHADLLDIQQAAQRSTELTRQLLTFARRETVAPRVLDLNETVTKALRMLQRMIGEDIEIAWHADGRLWPIRMDPSQVEQVLTNLFVNARDAIADVGTITVSTANTVIDRNHAAAREGAAPGDYVCLAIRDTGCGMDPQTLDRIFEPFFTTKGVGEGTGLGLATVYGAVKQNGGAITVSSVPGEGTTFEIYLPRYAGPAEPAVADRAATHAPRGSETILLVEDEPQILALAATVLEAQGYTVIRAGGPAEAIGLATTHVGPIDLVLSDVIMPEMNGQDLANQLMAMRPALKTLFMSGYPAGAIASRGVLDDGVPFISKPFTIVDLAVKVRDVLDRA